MQNLYLKPEFELIHYSQLRNNVVCSSVVPEDDELNIHEVFGGGSDDVNPY